MNRIKKVLVQGLGPIFIANITQKILILITTFILVRLIDKNTYGQWVYTLNVINLLHITQGLGIVPGIVQFSSAEKSISRKFDYLRFGVIIGVTFYILLIVGSILALKWFPFPIEGSTQLFTSFVWVILLMLMIQSIQSYLRSSFKNNKYSISIIIQSISIFILCTLGAIWDGVYGMIIGRYIAFVITVVFCVIAIYQDILSTRIFSHLKSIKKTEFFKFSAFCSLTTTISALFYYVDTFIIGLIIKSDSIVASYKTATIIPTALLFLPMSVITFAYPHFAKNHKDKGKIQKQFKLIRKYLGGINFLISLFLIVFAKYIIVILFGEQYSDSIHIFRTLAIGYFFTGTFRIPAGNTLASMKKVYINFVNGAICSIINILLDIILIKKFGVNGAAYATVITVIIYSISSNLLLNRVFSESNQHT